MSALEKLVARYQRDLYEPEREHLRRAELEAMQMYNEIAHELAEKVRSYDRLTLRMSGHVMAPLAQVANLIDPEVD